MLIRMGDLSKHDGLRTCETQCVASADFSLSMCMCVCCLFLDHERPLLMSHATNVRIKLFNKFLFFSNYSSFIQCALCDEKVFMSTVSSQQNAFIEIKNEFQCSHINSKHLIA